MELALADLQWSLCLIYLNVIVFACDVSGHKGHLGKVLMQIGAARIKLKTSKCVFFFAPKVFFLGHALTKREHGQT